MGEVEDWVDISKMSSDLIGPTIYHQGTLVRKYQKCGKLRCNKCREGKGHGPYWWRVLYDKETKKQTWKYVGRTI